MDGGGRVNEQIRNEACTMAGKTPEHAFTGYLEVDGIPIGPNMSLKEIQARRKRLGLEPLYQDPVHSTTLLQYPRLV